MENIKLIHIICAYITGVGFLLRGLLALLQSAMLQHRLFKILPHAVDTCLLFSGLIMMIHWTWWPNKQPWLLAKIIALLFYIVFGLTMLRWGKTLWLRVIGLIGGIATYIYIVGAAHSKSALSLLNLI
jgi:uncharacterized membrane protein SirB2